MQPFHLNDKIHLSYNTEVNKINGIIGKKLNQRYLIMKKIAEGGFGTTHLAKDELLNNSVAIKEITPSTSDSKELDSFEQHQKGADVSKLPPWADEIPEYCKKKS